MNRKPSLLSSVALAPGEGAVNAAGGRARVGSAQDQGTQALEPSIASSAISIPGPKPLFLGALCRVSAGKWTPMCSAYNSWFPFTSVESQGTCLQASARRRAPAAPAQKPARALGTAEAGCLPDPQQPEPHNWKSPSPGKRWEKHLRGAASSQDPGSEASQQC